MNEGRLEEFLLYQRLLLGWLQADNLEQLLEVLVDPDVDLMWRRWLVPRMSRFDGMRVVPVLIPMLSDDDFGLRGLAAEALGDYGRRGVPVDEATGALLRCAEEDDGYVRQKALVALSYIGEQRAVPGLAELAERPPYPSSRRATAAALGRLGAPEAETYFIGYLRKRADRGWAAGWLADIGTEASIRPLRAAGRRDPIHWREYRNAIEAIEARSSHASA